MSKAPSNAEGYNRLSIRELTVLVSSDYHPAIKNALDSVIVQLEAARKVEDGNPKFEKVVSTILNFRELFLEHAGKESRLLFPLLNVQGGKRQSGNEVAEIREFLGELKVEHRRLENEIDKIREYTDSYTCKPSASPSHKLAYAQLNEFEQDFNRLVFVEEQFLFPRVLLIHKKNNLPS
jgi:iron-sulfur cluster repair protein YtfE (RIC family)